MLRGSCLCGLVKFVVDGRVSDAGHCHCWKCRKVSGANSNAVLLTGAKSLHYSDGEDLVKRYFMPDGDWQSSFCGQCGCPMPHKDGDGKIWYVPLGAMDDDPAVPVAQHIHVSQKGSWEIIGGDAPQHDFEAPPQDS